MDSIVKLFRLSLRSRNIVASLLVLAPAGAIGQTGPVTPLSPPIVIAHDAPEGHQCSVLRRQHKLLDGERVEGIG